jgi:hypothetical protein
MRTSGMFRYLPAKRPQGVKRPVDVIGNAVKLMRIATGEEEDDREAHGVAATTSGQIPLSSTFSISGGET